MGMFQLIGAPAYEADRVWVARNHLDGTFGPIVRFNAVKMFTAEEQRKNVEDYADRQKLITAGVFTHSILNLTNLFLDPDAYDVLYQEQTAHYGTTPNRYFMREGGSEDESEAIALAVRLPAGLGGGGEIHWYPCCTSVGNNRYEYNGTAYVQPQLTLHAVPDPVLVKANGKPMAYRKFTLETLWEVTKFPLP